MNEVTAKPSEAIEMIKTAFKAGRTPFLHGSPGIGKSDIVKQVARDLGMKMFDLRATTIDPVDLRGVPKIVEEQDQYIAKWAIPDFLPREEGVILFLDEMTSAPPMMQAGCYQLVLDKRIGNYKVPNNCFIIGAGNREGDKAIVHRISSALANRFSPHINLVVDKDDWIVWARNNKIHTDVIYFIHGMPQHLNTFDSSKNEKAFATPRTWEFVSDILYTEPPQHILTKMLAGTIGGVTHEFLHFKNLKSKLPNPRKILNNPSSYDVPKKHDMIYAMVCAILTIAGEKDVKNVLELSNVISDAHEGIFRDISILLAKDMCLRFPEVAIEDGFEDWIVRNEDLLGV